MSETQPPPGELNFEQALGELETIVADLEDGSLTLDDSLLRFESGMKLLRQCQALLQQAEQKIEVLTSVSRDGTERTRPLSESAPAAPVAEEPADDAEGTLF